MLVTSVVAILLVLVVAVIGAWIAGLIQFGDPVPEVPSPSTEASRPAQVAPAPPIERAPKPGAEDGAAPGTIDP